MSVPARGERPQVVHLVESLGRGGLEQVVETLACGLHRAHFEVSLLTLSGEGPVADRIRRRGLLVEPVGFTPRLRPATVAALASRLRAVNAQVVHGHGWLAGAFARLAGWKAKVPCRVAHRHTTDEGETLRHRIFERAIGGLGRTICCSEAVRASALRNGADPLRAEIVYNGVSPDRFGRRLPAPGQTCPTLICVASLRSLKGHRVLLEAVSRLAASGVAFRLQLVGNGPERDYLERIARALDVSRRVDFLGERDDIPALLESADLFVLPTTGREGLGLAAIEAMAAGLPVVASEIGGLPEVVRHGRTGYLVPPGDPGALEQALLDLLSEPEHARALGAEGRRRVEAQFGADAMVARVAEIYRRDLEPSTTGRTILYLSSRGTRFGGGQAGLKMLAAGVADAGYRPFVVVPESGDLTAELAGAGVPTKLLPLPRLRSWRIDRSIRAALRLRRLARILQPSVVHVDGVRGALYALCLPESIRRVWHLRDFRSDPLDDWLAPRFDRLISVCTATVSNRFPLETPERAVVVPNAVEAHRHDADRDAVRRQLGIAPDDFVLLTAGRVEPQKGTGDLVEALALLDRDGVEARALLAGEVDTREASRIHRLAERRRVSWRLKLLGRRDDLPELMEAADLLVHPSWYEAAPRVVLEAMAAGLPVVATSVGGVPEILDRCGVLVPDRAPRALACAIAALSRDPERRRLLGARGRERHLRFYTPDRHVATIVEIYDLLLGAERARREAA
jgi:glycosyltransferase involved in cell wall biosynthesis